MPGLGAGITVSGLSLVGLYAGTVTRCSLSLDRSATVKSQTRLLLKQHHSQGSQHPFVDLPAAALPLDFFAFLFAFLEFLFDHIFPFTSEPVQGRQERLIDEFVYLLAIVADPKEC